MFQYNFKMVTAPSPAYILVIIYSQYCNKVSLITTLDQSLFTVNGLPFCCLILQQLRSHQDLTRSVEVYKNSQKLLLNAATIKLYNAELAEVLKDRAEVYTF